MGNAAGKLNGATVCDGGSLAPHGIYAEDGQDYDVRAVQKLMLARQLAPFYAGADDPDPDPEPGASADDGGWWSYSLMLAQQQQQQDTGAQDTGAQDTDVQATGAGSRHARKGSGLLQRLRVSPGARHERSFSDVAAHEPSDVSLDACRRLLRRCVECPICFLYYPRNTNYTRCCHKPICSECFVQIKRKLDDDHVVPAHCPYCVEPGLGVVYYAPVLEPHTPVAGARRAGPRVLGEAGRARSQSSAASVRKPVVVLSDDIRPNRLRQLTNELEARRREQLRSADSMALVAEATRRMSARDARALAAGSRGALRTGATRQEQLATQYASFVGAMRAAGHTDLEEFLVEEAIRQSLAEQAESEQAESEHAEAEPASDVPEVEPAPDLHPLNSDESGSEPLFVSAASVSESAADTQPEPETALDTQPEAEPGLDAEPAASSSISQHSTQLAVSAAAPSSSSHEPLTLEPFELDAIASIGATVNKKKRRPAPPPPATHGPRPSSPASSQTLTPSMPGDLLAFASDHVVSSTNPFAAAMADLPVSPTLRPRRRPPPPPPTAARASAAAGQSQPQPQKDSEERDRSSSTMIF
ncbi:SNF1-interacting protein [Coemansia sp. RSA 2702]|nr:SNF1-interacting protein [Coemansia sp. RSA 2702]